MDEEEKRLLYAHYHGDDQQWQVSINTKGGDSLVGQIKLLAKVPVTSEDFSFRYADQHDATISEEALHRIYEEGAEPSRVSQLVTDWTSRPKHYVTSFEEFEHRYRDMLPAYTEFEASIAYALLYNTEKWRVVVEVIFLSDFLFFCFCFLVGYTCSLFRNSNKYLL